ARIVHTLSEKVLAETSLLALQRAGQRLERAIVRTSQHASAASVIEESVHSFLQHPLFVADDNLRSSKLDQLLEPVVAVDNAAIEIVQIRRREASAIQRHQRPKL